MIYSRLVFLSIGLFFIVLFCQKTSGWVDE